MRAILEIYMPDHLLHGEGVSQADINKQFNELKEELATEDGIHRGVVITFRVTEPMCPPPREHDDSPPPGSAADDASDY